jgi:hypothetical protein
MRRESPLHFAARNGDFGMVARLLEGLVGFGGSPDGVFGKNTDGRTALHLGAIHGDGIVVQLLASCKADVNARDNFGQTPLHLAVANGHKGAAQQLLGDSADVDAIDECGRTPLHLAAKSGRRDLVELLLVNYAEVNTRDNSGNTPLNEATREGHRDVAELLRQRGGTESQPMPIRDTSEVGAAAARQDTEASAPLPPQQFQGAMALTPGALSTNTASAVAHAATQGRSYVCDICATSIEKTSGYACTTRQVLTSVRYWRWYFEDSRELSADADGRRRGACRVYARGSGDAVDRVRGLRPVHVEADSKAARNYAAGNHEPPGCGTIEAQIACIPAAYGWSLAHNEWPVSIQVGKNPIIHDTKSGSRCDFCRRILYGDEKFGLLFADTYKKLMDDGAVFVRKPPPSQQVNGADSWIACNTCL